MHLVSRVRWVKTDAKSTNDPRIKQFFNNIELPFQFQFCKLHTDYKQTQDVPSDIQNLVKGLMYHFRSVERGWRGKFDAITNFKQNRAASSYIGDLDDLSQWFTAATGKKSAERFELELHEVLTPDVYARRQAFMPHVNRFRDERFCLDIGYFIKLRIIGRHLSLDGDAQDLAEVRHSKTSRLPRFASIKAKLQAVSPFSGRDSRKNGGIFHNMKERWKQMHDLHTYRWFKCGRFLPLDRFVKLLDSGAMPMPEAARTAAAVLLKALDNDRIWSQPWYERLYRGVKLLNKLVAIGGLAYTGGAAVLGAAGVGAGGASGAAGAWSAATSATSGGAAVYQAMGMSQGAAQVTAVSMQGKSLLGLKEEFKKIKRDVGAVLSRQRDPDNFIDKGMPPPGYVFVKFNGLLTLTIEVSKT